MECDTRKCEVIDVFGRSRYSPQHRLCGAIGLAFGAAKLLSEFIHIGIDEYAV
ncbi:hypothetical protein C4J91_2812 [Pseudomonas sp. R3-52-08]|nr:hypothetical protein C4J91_2812 [Pseudomonas sp. R3-52-08]